MAAESRTRAEVVARLAEIRRENRGRRRVHWAVEREVQLLEARLAALDSGRAPARAAPARSGRRGAVFDPSKLVPELRCNRPR